MRPAGLPPMVISKKTFGLAIVVLAKRQNAKRIRPRFALRSEMIADKEGFDSTCEETEALESL